MTTTETAIAEAIDHAIGATIASTATAVADTAPIGNELVRAIQLAVAGGKRMRARAIIASYEAHGGTDVSSVTPLCAAVELFQAAALVHDDVLDGADTRRGQPTPHRVFASAHRERGDVGDATHFGMSAAILTGDLALMAAFRAADAMTGVHASATRALFTEMTELVTVGQYLDMRISAQPLGSLPGQLADIRATMRAKTASYTAEFPLALGAAAARGAGPHVDAARRAGLPAGIAFQLRDDLLGIVGTEQATGKSVGGDIREGKRTVPLWHAWTRSGANGRTALMAAVGNADATAAQIATAIDVIRHSGAVATTEAEIEALAADVAEMVGLLAVPPEASATLAALLQGWGARSR